MQRVSIVLRTTIVNGGMMGGEDGVGEGDNSGGEGKTSDWLCIMTEIGIELCRLFVFFCFFFVIYFFCFQSIFRSEKTIEHLISPRHAHQHT